ncbi:ribosome maturation factor RimP [uncultured Jatrophihabitans sp.]|uniref:ribosome maturation factor RimP n=1 Tax=uncultured Jatrophihabitans sp. TaxID=1610747 RepID=UPI0035CB9C2E
MPPVPHANAGGSGGTAAQAREHLLDLLGPLVDDAGYDLEDVTVSAAGRRSMVRVIVDGDDGIDLDAVAVVSRVISDALDADSFDTASARPLAGSYVLEVTSPGVDRPLTEQRHWRRARGRLVTADVDGAPLTGRVGDVDDRGVTLDVDGRDRVVAWPSLGRGKVQIEFNRPEEA